MNKLLSCFLSTSDAADESRGVDFGGSRKNKTITDTEHKRTNIQHRQITQCEVIQ